VFEPYVEVGGKRLKRGFTTGMCAAAAAKGAALALLGSDCGQSVKVKTPQGFEIEFEIVKLKKGEGYSLCCVYKDGGDDPDVTSGLKICARVEKNTSRDIIIKGGPGVGRVTKPGLAVPVGEAAINPVPRKLIKNAVREVLPKDTGAVVEISVPGGEEAAFKTLNPKLGIVGGISILGTSGIVEPMSLEVWKRSLLPQVRVAVAQGHRELVLTPGRKGEKLAVERYGFPAESVVQMSNFVGDMLKECVKSGVKKVLLFGHHGKLLKVAAGNFQTHSRISDGRLETIAALAALCGAGSDTVGRILESTTAEETLEVLSRCRDGLLHEVFNLAARRASTRANEYTRGCLEVDTALLSLQGDILGTDSHHILLKRGNALNFPLLREEEKYGSDKIYNGICCRQIPKKKIYVIGAGPGSPDYLTPAACKVVKKCDILIGGERSLALFKDLNKEMYPLKSNLKAVVDIIRAKSFTGRVAVIASGDPGMYGILAFLLRHFSRESLVVIPGISSIQLALARAGMTWHDATVFSLHGRQRTKILQQILQRLKCDCSYVNTNTIVVLMDPGFLPQDLARFLLDGGLSGKRFIIAENLSTSQERVLEAKLEKVPALTDKFRNCVVIIADR